MKLSEAIMLGSALKPQGTNNNSMLIGAKATCALGAALDATIGLGKTIELAYYTTNKEWPYLDNPVSCPVCRARWQVMSIIWHLNDTHLWSREDIARWVATVEPQESLNIEAATQVELAKLCLGKTNASKSLQPATS